MVLSTISFGLSTCNSGAIPARVSFWQILPEESGIRNSCRNSSGIPSRGSQQWHTMEKSLHDLLINHPGEEPDAIIHRSHHILFKNRLADNKRKGKFKHDSREALRERIRAIGWVEGMTHKKTACREAGLAPLNSTLACEGARCLPRTKVVVWWNHCPDALLQPRLKPTLTNANELHRLLYAMDQLKPGCLSLHVPKFQDQMDKVHLDKKWFWLCQDGEKYILVD
jgi:hypothetical protein